MNAQSPKDRRAEWEALLLGHAPLKQLPDFMQELLCELDQRLGREPTTDFQSASLGEESASPK